jgi:hypothetical protein
MDTNFNSGPLHEQGAVEADARGRITLPASARKLTSATRFKVFTTDDGSIVLQPVVDIPAREAWLYENREAHAMLEAGLTSARTKSPVSLGSFTKYATDDED